MTSCVDVLHILKNHKHASPFLQPVDVNLLPSYYDVVKHPTDLSSIKSKLENGAYANPRCFEFEVRTMFANAYQYNRRGSVVSRKCRALEKKFNNFFPPPATRKSSRRRKQSTKLLNLTARKPAQHHTGAKALTAEGAATAVSCKSRGKRQRSYKHTNGRKRRRAENTADSSISPRTCALRAQIKSLKQMIQKVKDDMRHSAFISPGDASEKVSKHKAEEGAQAKRQFAMEFQTLTPKQQMHILRIMNKSMFLYTNDRTKNIDVDLTTIDDTTFKKIKAYLKVNHMHRTNGHFPTGTQLDQPYECTHRC